jgi:hypothetical protein
MNLAFIRRHLHIAASSVIWDEHPATSNFDLYSLKDLAFNLILIGAKL